MAENSNFSRRKLSELLNEMISNKEIVVGRMHHQYQRHIASRPAEAFALLNDGKPWEEYNPSKDGKYFNYVDLDENYKIRE